jgi:hypothetical protein
MHLVVLVAAVLLGGALGCGGEEPVADPPTPLTVAQWKTLPPEEKYDPATFERLKDADPKLRSPAGWEKFMVEVVVPERTRDIPSKPRYGN